MRWYGVFIWRYGMKPSVAWFNDYGNAVDAETKFLSEGYNVRIIMFGKKGIQVVRKA